MARIQKFFAALSFAFALSACSADNPALDGSQPPDQALRADAKSSPDLVPPTDFSTGDAHTAPSDLAATPDFSEPDLAMPTRPDLAMPDLVSAPMTCLPSGGCMAGVKCGNICCGQGERCDPNTGACRCGNNNPCAPAQHCSSGGPQGQNGCGLICCGGKVPCPF